MLVTGKASLILVSPERMGVAYILSSQEAEAEVSVSIARNQGQPGLHSKTVSKGPRKEKGGGVRKKNTARALVQGQAQVSSLQGKRHCSWHQRSLAKKMW